MVPEARLQVGRRDFFKYQRTHLRLLRCIPYRCFDHIGSGRETLRILAVHVHDEVAFFHGIACVLMQNHTGIRTHRIGSFIAADPEIDSGNTDFKGIDIRDKAVLFRFNVAGVRAAALSAFGNKLLRIAALQRNVF